MNLTRRGFMRAGTVVAAGATLTQFTSLSFALPKSMKDWITDMGDFYLLDVPDGKVFSGFKFDKPLVANVARFAEISHIEVVGPMQLYLNDKSTFRDSHVDCSKGLVDGAPAALYVVNNPDSPEIYLGGISVFKLDELTGLILRGGI